MPSPAKQEAAKAAAEPETRPPPPAALIASSGNRPSKGKPHMSEHRDKAVEAVSAISSEFVGAATIGHSAAREVIDAADPHLRAQHFEEFREGLLEEEAITVASRARSFVKGSEAREIGRTAAQAALIAALDKITPTQEGENGG